MYVNRIVVHTWQQQHIVYVHNKKGQKIAYGGGSGTRCPGCVLVTFFSGATMRAECEYPEFVSIGPLRHGCASGVCRVSQVGETWEALMRRKTSVPENEHENKN